MTTRISPTNLLVPRRGPSARSIRRTARRLLRRLRIEPPLTVEALREALESERERLVRLIPHEFPDTATNGLVVVTETADVVFYEAHLTEDHQCRVILHEFGHLVFEHSGETPDVSDAVWRSIAPTLPREYVRAVMCRSAHDSPEELQAEKFGRVLAAWDAEITKTTPREGRRGGSRLERAFDQPRGWL